MGSSTPSFRLLFLADTHLGFDHPVRPRVERRRRGPDFLENFRRVLTAAVEQQVDLVLHGGDLFFRSKVPAAIVDTVYSELLEFAGHGIPLVIVPGNHERSRLPTSLFLQHPSIHVFDAPRTFTFKLGGARVAIGGFPSVRRDVRDGFRKVVAATGLDDTTADTRLLCMHQTVEGASVGPRGYTFRDGHDVIRQRDLPTSCDAVLAGHIHRHQIIEVARDGSRSMPVVYPGSTERTSFAEAAETKGYCRLEFERSTEGVWRLARTGFVALPARPMVTVEVPTEMTPAGVTRLLNGVVRDVPPDAIVRFVTSGEVSPALRREFSAARLSRSLPTTLNIHFGSGFFDRPRRESTS